VLHGLATAGAAATAAAGAASATAVSSDDSWCGGAATDCSGPDKLADDGDLDEVAEVRCAITSLLARPACTVTSQR
jgi:hypothetical protein